MAIGTVSVVEVNNHQGAFVDVERTALFVGVGAAGAQSGVLSVGAGSDLDALFGSAASSLKTQVAAAIANAADDNFFAYAIALSGNETWTDAVYAALDKPVDANPELIVVCDPVAAAAAVTAAQTLASQVLASFAKFVTVHLCTAGIAAEQSWSEYVTAQKAITNGIVADRVSVTPLLHGNNLGVVVGRLCSRAASIADSPMKVSTGAVVALGESPVDENGAALTMATLTELANARFSVPEWYPGYEGVYWADHPLLDAEGGDFTVVENRRVLDYLARRVRIRAIQRIGDRRLNSTARSIAENKAYFAGPLRDAAKAVAAGIFEYPAMIEPPDADSIGIVWTDRTHVAVAITARPYSSPKAITLYLALDLSNE